MVALKNLALSENLALPCPFENSAPPDSKSLLSFWTLAPKAIFFSRPPFFFLPYCLEGGVGCILNHLSTSKSYSRISFRDYIEFICFAGKKLQRKFSCRRLISFIISLGMISIRAKWTFDWGANMSMLQSSMLLNKMYMWAETGN